MKEKTKQFFIGLKYKLKSVAFLQALISPITTLLLAFGVPVPANLETILLSIVTLLGLLGFLKNPEFCNARREYKLKKYAKKENKRLEAQIHSDNTKDK